VEAIDIESIQPIIISGSNEHDGFDNSNPEKFSAANIVGATVSATATARMKTYAVGNINVLISKCTIIKTPPVIPFVCDNMIDK
jgi:hypothetical protein